MNEVLDIVKKNSGVQSINENTASDIASTQIMVGELINEKYNNSLAYQICEVIPLEGTHGIAYASKRDNSDFKVVKKDIYTKITPLNTGYTQEVLEDMLRMFKKRAKQVASAVLGGVSDQEENRTVIDLLDAESEIQTPLILTDQHNFETVLHEISKKVSESVVKINRVSYKSLDSFCVLSGKWASAILASYAFMSEGKERILFVGRIGRTDYFINPFPNTASQFNNDYDIDFEIENSSIPDYAYVGIKSKTSGYSSLIFSPHSYESRYIIDPSDGNVKLFTYNRYGLISSPLHDPISNNSMIHKFAIEVAP